MSELAKALTIAIRVHAGQVDKQGEPYLLHVLRVVEAVSDEAKVVAALHDVIEDGRYHGDEEQAKLADECELGEDHFYALIWLTRFWSDEGLTYAGYIERIAEASGRAGKLAREVKLADLRDNLARIPSDSLPFGRQNEWASLRRRYEKAIATLDVAG